MFDNERGAHPCIEPDANQGDAAGAVRPQAARPDAEQGPAARVIAHGRNETRGALEIVKASGDEW